MQCENFVEQYMDVCLEGGSGFKTFQKKIPCENVFDAIPFYDLMV